MIIYLIFIDSIKINFRFAFLLCCVFNRTTISMNPAELFSTVSWEFILGNLKTKSLQRQDWNQTLSRHSKHSSVALARYRNENHRTELFSVVRCVRNGAIRIWRFLLHSVHYRTETIIFAVSERIVEEHSSSTTTEMQQQITGHQWQPACIVTVQRNMEQKQRNIYRNP